MEFYFVQATSAVGPVNFPVSVDNGLAVTIDEAVLEIAASVAAEATRRGLVFSSEWAAEKIDEAEFQRLSGESDVRVIAFKDGECLVPLRSFVVSGVARRRRFARALADQGHRLEFRDYPDLGVRIESV